MNNSFINDGEITEMICGSNLSYIINLNESFSQTQFKVLQNKETLFARCMKMMRNGKLQIFYIVEGYKSLSSLAIVKDEEKFFSMLNSLVFCIAEIKKVGFLDCRNLDLDPDHIYIDTESNKVKMIYFPMTVQTKSGTLSFESAFQTAMISFLNKTPFSQSKTAENWIAKISTGELSDPATGGHVPDPPEPTGYCTLISLDTVNPLRLIIKKDEYLVGRKKGFVDGLIPFNAMIGRVHCKIVYMNKNFYVVDLKSLNGTFLNGIQLNANTEYAIKDGDVLQFATSAFHVEIH